MVYPELMTIPFNTTKAEILTTIKGKELVQYRPPMKGNTGKHNQRSTIFFHKDKGMIYVIIQFWVIPQKFIYLFISK
jgi:hypothetical protein